MANHSAIYLVTVFVSAALLITPYQDPNVVPLLAVVTALTAVSVK